MGWGVRHSIRRLISIGCVVFSMTSAATVAFAASPADSKAAQAADGSNDVVLTCTLTDANDYGSFDPSKHRAISKAFVIVFNDNEKAVSYVGGPAMSITTDPVWKTIFQNQIEFTADAAPQADGTILRYSGAVNRLTGKIYLYTLYVRNKSIVQSLPNTEETGSCLSGTRKF